MILLGFGQGMANGIEKEFSRNASNTIWIWSNVTSKEHKGLNPGRRIRFENENLQDILNVHNERANQKQIEQKNDRVKGIHKNSQCNYYW